MPATAAESKRRRYQLDVNMRRRVPLGRRMLQMTLGIDDAGHGGLTATELAENLDIDRRVIHVFARRLRDLGLIRSTHVRDPDSRTGRSVIYTCTQQGELLADAWRGFIRAVGPALCRKLRLGDD